MFKFLFLFATLLMSTSSVRAATNVPIPKDFTKEQSDEHLRRLAEQAKETLMNLSKEQLDVIMDHVPSEHRDMLLLGILTGFFDGGDGEGDGGDGYDGGSTSPLAKLFFPCSLFQTLVNLVGFLPASLLSLACPAGFGGGCFADTAEQQANLVCNTILGIPEMVIEFVTGEIACSEACTDYYTQFCSGCAEPPTEASP